MRTKLIALAATGLLAVALAGCTGESTKDGADVPSDRIGDLKNARVWRLPDNFRNVTIGCDGPNLVYVTSAGSETDSKVGSGIAVVPNDPYCQGVTR